ncbi:MAG TPA: autotransporter-associated beta strand repeat-containing protein [Pseudomonadales bacterium]|nr:autotransporter-associated beta strand repeat-containing protein [Pseudomonadales bacterium]
MRILKKANFQAAGLLAALLVSVNGTARAALDTWTGAASANWADSNWTGGNNPPGSGDSLIFTSATGAGGAVLNNNLTSSSFNLANITYNSSAAAFTVSGNAFNLAGNITNNSASLETINDPFSLAGTQTFTTTSGGGNLVFGGSLSGAGGITLAGSGTVTLSGANSYSGVTTINGGTLFLNNTAALPATTVLTVNNSGIVDLNGKSETIANFGTGSANGWITNSASSAAALTITNWNVGLNPPIANGANGTVALNFMSIGSVFGGSLNNNNSTFSGGVVLGNVVSGSGYARFQVTATPVNSGSPGAINSSIFGRGTITIGTSPTDKAQLYITASSCTILNNIVCNSALGSDRLGAIRSDFSTLTLAGTLTANQAPVCLNCNSVNTGTVLLTGQVTGPNGFWLRYNPSDPTAYFTCTLDNVTANANNYQGPTEIDSPYILAMGAANQIPSGANTGNVTNNGTLKLNGYSQTIDGLWGTGVVDGASGSPTLTVGANNATAANSCTVENSSGSLNLTKAGSGTATFTGTTSYSGNTTVNGGVLSLQQPGFNSRSTITIASGATLDLPGSGSFVVANLILNGVPQSSGTYSSANTTYITGQGQLVVEAGGSVDTWTGATSANWNDSNWTGGNNPPYSGDSLIFTGTTGAGGTTLNNNLTSSSFNLTNITFSSGAAAFTVNGNAFVLYGTIANNGANLETINDPFNLPGTQTFTTASGGGNLTFGGNLSGGGGIAVNGSGIVMLSGANNYSGVTTVNGGTLKLNNAAALPVSTILTVNGGNLDLNGKSETIANFGSGSANGWITNSAAGAGALTLTNWNIGLNTLVADGASGPVALNFISAGSISGGSLNNNASTFSGGLTLGNAVSGSGYARLSVNTPVNNGAPGNIISSPFGRGTITIGQAPTDKAQLICNNGGVDTLLNNIVFNTAQGADRVGAFRVDATTAVLAGTLTANMAPVSFAAASTVGTGYAFVAGQITGTNGLWLRYNSSQGQDYMTCVLSNLTANANNYQGLTEIDAPYVLAMGAANQIPNGASAGDVTNNGTFNLNGYNQTINGLLGGGIVNGVSGTPILTLGGDNETSTFGGRIINSGGSLSVTKIGTSTQTLAGQNTYSGATIINAGVLQGAVGGSCSNSAVTVAATTTNTAMLGIPITDVTKQWTCSSLTVNNAGASSGLQFTYGLITPGTIAAPLNVTGGVTFSTPPAITVSGSGIQLTSGNGYPLLTWGAGSPPDLTGATLTFVPAIYSGNLSIVGNTLYLQCTNISASSLSLTVTNGTGSGYYANGSQIAISGVADPAGMVFSYWAINSGNPVIANSNAPSTTLTMPPGSTASVTAIFTNIPVPPPIAGMGFSLAWNDEFDNGLKSIDLGNTQTNGYKWYVQPPFTGGPVSSSEFTNPQPSVVRILGSGPNNGGEQLVSSVSMNVGYNVADSAGFYVEGRIRFLTSSFDTTYAWPAFWLRGTEGITGTAAPWPGTTNGWQNSVEIDIMEYYGGTSYGSALHNWYGFGPFTDTGATTTWPFNSYGSNPSNVWHTYGCLMIPSWQTTNGMGYAEMFLDNVFVTKYSVSWLNPTNLYTSNPNATNAPTGGNVLSTTELWHHIIAVGTAATNCPIDVDWVRVWQPVTMTSLGIQTNSFGLRIGDYHTSTVVEACTNLTNPVWLPIQTNSINAYLTNSNPFLNNPLNANPIYFRDSQWTNYPNRFYRLFWP